MKIHPLLNDWFFAVLFGLSFLILSDRLVAQQSTDNITAQLPSQSTIGKDSIVTSVVVNSDVTLADNGLAADTSEADQGIALKAAPILLDSSNVSPAESADRRLGEVQAEVQAELQAEVQAEVPTQNVKQSETTINSEPSSSLDKGRNESPPVTVETDAVESGPSEELSEIVEALHASAESVEQNVETPKQLKGSFLQKENLPGNPQQLYLDSVTEASPSDVEAVIKESELARVRLRELRMQRAAEQARQRAIRLQQQLRLGYSPLRPSWNAVPMMRSRYSRPVIYIPVYTRSK